MAATSKLTVGLSMLADTRDGDFDTAYGTLQKILGNIVANPAEPKYRSLKKSNAKINALLQTSGVRVTLVGAGFVEEGDVLRMPDDVPADGAQAALQGLAQQAADRAAADTARKAALQASKHENQEKENEDRKRMKAGIEDDSGAQGARMEGQGRRCQAGQGHHRLFGHWRWHWRRLMLSRGLTPAGFRAAPAASRDRPMAMMMPASSPRRLRTACAPPRSLQQQRAHDELS